MSATSADRLRGAELRARCVDLRRGGMSYDAIARTVGTSKANAHKHVTVALRELRATTEEVAEDVRAIELERLDKMLAGLWPAATTGDTSAVSTVLRLQERRARLLGLDAPARVGVGGQDGGPVTFVDIARRVMADRLADDDVRQLAAIAGRVGEAS